MSDLPEEKAFVQRRVLRDSEKDPPQVQQDIESQLKSHDFDKDAMWAIRLALEEGIANAFTHGNKRDPKKSVEFYCRIDNTHAVFEVCDEGAGFDPGTVPDPTDEENIEIPSGRGIMLMRAYMDEVSYLTPGNRLRMVYRKK